MVAEQHARYCLHHTGSNVFAGLSTLQISVSATLYELRAHFIVSGGSRTNHVPICISWSIYFQTTTPIHVAIIATIIIFKDTHKQQQQQ